MKKLSFEDIKNIVDLLKDPDDKIFQILEPQILSSGKSFYDYFQETYKTTDNDILKDRLKKIIEKLAFEDIHEKFRYIPILSNGDIDLEEASFILSCYGYPAIDKNDYKKLLDEMAENLREKVEHLTDPLMIIKKINQYLFLAEGFKGNRGDYFNPDNSFINTVIEKKTGIPITLSVVYLLITKRLNLPFYGVSMPGHFIVKYKSDDLEIFVDPFHSGKILSRADCINFLLFSGYGFSERFLEATSNKEIFKRMIRNLLLIYQESNDNYKYEKLKDVLNIVDINY